MIRCQVVTEMVMLRDENGESLLKHTKYVLCITNTICFGKNNSFYLQDAMNLEGLNPFGLCNCGQHHSNFLQQMSTISLITSHYIIKMSLHKLFNQLLNETFVISYSTFLSSHEQK